MGKAGSDLFLSCFLLIALTLCGVSAQKDACRKPGAQFAYDLENCHYFYACVGPIPVRMTCPEDLVFSMSEKNSACVFRDNIEAKDCMSRSFNPQDQRDVADEPKKSTGHGDGSIHDSDMYKEMGLDGGDSMGDYKEMDEYKEKFPITLSVTTKSPNVMDSYEAMDGEYKKMDEYQNKDNGIARERRCQGDATIVPHESLCHRYFDCINPRMDAAMNRYLTTYEYECPYPKLFSLSTLQCEDFDSVDCGDRMEYLDPCEYSDNMCSGPNCVPCTVDHASCLKQPDGLMYWPGREGTGFWVECRNQRTVSQGNCGHDEKGMMEVFSTKHRKCVPYSEIIDEVCYWTSATQPHPTECHMYYDCTMHSDTKKTEAMSPMSYMKMCPYLQLYSIRTGQCEDYNKVNCAGRREAKTPCDYMECLDPTYGSCEDLPDGANVFRTREGTPHYVMCKDERTVDKKMCLEDSRGFYMEFAPGLRRCAPI